MRTGPVLTLVAVVALVVVLALVARPSGSGEGGLVGEVAIDGDTLAVGAVPASAARFLDEGRFWRASRELRAYLRGSAVATPEARLLAARAEAGWGGWSMVVEYLAGQPWLDEARGGEGWFWLGRGYDELGRDREAVEAYGRYLELTGTRGGTGPPSEEAPTFAPIAELRRALVWLRTGELGRGVAGLDGVRLGGGQFGAWIGVLAAEARAEAGDTAGVRSMVGTLPQGGNMRHRARVAQVRAHEVAGDLPAAIRAAVAARGAGGLAAQRAELAYLAGSHAAAAGDAGTAWRELRAALELGPGTTFARDAVDPFLRLPALAPGDRLLAADVDARHGNHTRSIEGYRAWLAAAGAAAAQRDDVRLRLGRTLFAAGDFLAAEETIRPLRTAAAPIAREALLLAGRSQLRRGDTDGAVATLRQLAARFPGSDEGSEGLYLVADLRHEAGDDAAASQLYREVATGFRGTDRAGLSLMRLAGIRYRGSDYRGAAAVWDEYRTAYPAGSRWLEATYWAARAREQLGDSAAARSLYAAVRERDPLSYYALLASERLGVAFWPVRMGPDPPPDPPAAERVGGWMRTVDLLRDAGLHREADAEALRLAELTGLDTATRYALAEALNERGYAIRGIRIGQSLQEASAVPNARLLRILYPFSFRSLIEAEAREQGLDTFVAAALIRQESLFTARISSPVGARGLMQIMPQTGREIAAGIGLGDFDVELLFHPEINVHLGTVYLAEQMRRYDGSLPAVFSAYNAGPHRIDAWMRFPEYGDEELFTERIPFRETRDYVKILTRNISLYRGLYGDPEGL